jgi:valyl-tRNA synthetase
LWQRLPGHQSGEYLARAKWPEATNEPDSTAAREFELVRETVLAVRQIRGDNNVPPGKSVDVLIKPAAGADTRALFERETATIGRLTRSAIQLIDTAPSGAAAHAVISGGTEIVIPLAGLIDVDKECARLRTDVADLGKQITAREGRLNNAKYVERAPADVVANDRSILEEMKNKREQLILKVRSLCGD